MTQVPDGYWRVDRATNVKDLIAAETAEEAAKKALQQKKLEEQLAQLHVVAQLHTSITSGWTHMNRFQIRFQNNSDRPISGMTGKISSVMTGFDETIRGNLQIAPGEATNGVWEMRANQFLEPTERMFALGETDRFTVEIDSIAFEDGSEVKRESE